jgi:hypothetical protein
MLGATGMGHNYFMVILPGSMPTGILISKAMTLCKPWWPLLVSFGFLLVASLVLGFWLKRRKRRALLVEGS